MQEIGVTKERGRLPRDGLLRGVMWQNLDYLQLDELLYFISAVKLGAPLHYTHMNMPYC